MKLGIDRLLTEPELSAPLRGRRVAVLAHPASVTSGLVHTLDAVAGLPDIRLTAAFGPQHGIRGDKQDNMVETEDAIDPKHGIPVFSLYGKARRPTSEMCEMLDVLLIDLQDLGARIYTFLTTVLYALEAGARHAKEVWILDRPNPIGRPIEGTRLLPGNESFVGASTLPMRHGLTLGEAARWFVTRHGLDVKLQVVSMLGYNPHVAPGFGWCFGQIPWINPSPNAASLNMGRCYPGTVLFEGTTLSEGRGTTAPLEVIGAPDIDRDQILATMRNLRPDWLKGAYVRPCSFEPTFHKHTGMLCNGIQIHTDWRGYDHFVFRPYRLGNLFLKALRVVHPHYPIWRNHPYEYTGGRLPIDVIDGGPMLREWVDDPSSTFDEREAVLARDEAEWVDEINSVLLYP
ncbi:MAG: DUF1343 domain-containing protein [bacterium]